MKQTEALHLARRAALNAATVPAGAPHGYLPKTQEEANRWTPHEWVIELLMSTCVLSPSEQQACLENPEILLALADQHSVWETEADAFDAPESGKHHNARYHELRATARELIEVDPECFADNVRRRAGFVVNNGVPEARTIDVTEHNRQQNLLMEQLRTMFDALKSLQRLQKDRGVLPPFYAQLIDDVLNLKAHVPGRVYRHKDGRKVKLMCSHPDDGATIIVEDYDRNDGEICVFTICERSDLGVEVPEVLSGHDPFIAAADDWKMALKVEGMSAVSDALQEFGDERSQDAACHLIIAVRDALTTPVKSKVVQDFMREFIALCANGDIDETTDDGLGWSTLVADAKGMLA